MEDGEALKEYARPPLIEVALMVQFERIGPLNTLAITDFLRDFVNHADWQFVESPNQPPQYESEQTGLVNQTISFGPASTDHCFNLVSNNRSRIVSIQSDRFGVRWVRSNVDQDYIRYDRIRSFFEHNFLRFKQWLILNGLPVPIIKQAEVQYVNLVPEDNPTRFFNFLDMSGFTEAEGVQFSASQFLKGAAETGRLYLEALTQHVLNQDYKQLKALQMILTFRGQPVGIDVESALSHLDRGHEAIVRTFSQSLSEEGREYWGEKERENG